MTKKYMMNMEAIRYNDKEKYNFLCEIFRERSRWWSGNSIPVIDLTSGKIYEGLALGMSSKEEGYQTAYNNMRKAIEEEDKYEGYIFYDGLDYDDNFEHVLGHRFMDAGSMDLFVLKSLYEGYLNRKKEKEKKEKEEEESIKKFLKASNELNSVISDVKEMIK